MASVNQDIKLYVGDYIVLEVLVHKADGTNIGPESLSARYALSKRAGSPALFTKSSDENEIEITTEDETLLLRISIYPEDTVGLNSGYYYHEVELKDTNFDNRYYTVMTGKVNLVSTVLRSETIESE